MELGEVEKAKFDALLTELGTSDFEENLNDKEFINIRDKFMKQIAEIEKRTICSTVDTILGYV